MATLSKNPRSKRSIRRAKRNFTASRPNRRAGRRLSESIATYDRAVSSSSTGGREYTKPGAMRHW